MADGLSHCLFLPDRIELACQHGHFCRRDCIFVGWMERWCLSSGCRDATVWRLIFIYAILLNREKERRHTVASLQRTTLATLFRNRYRVDSARLPGWDYSSHGCYFVTVCTKERNCILSKIVNGDIVLTPVGCIVGQEFRITEKIRPNVSIDEYAVMPNHIHAIIRIGLSDVETPRCGVSNSEFVPTQSGETPQRGVSTKEPQKPRQDSLGSIIGHIKTSITKRARHLGYHSPLWQPRFHDHVIRDETEYHLIRRYIQDNPANWESDHEFDGPMFHKPKRGKPWYVYMP